MALPCYNGDWTPNWNAGENKYVIERINDSLNKGLAVGVYADIAFKTEEARDAFFSNHIDLLRTYFELD